MAKQTLEQGLRNLSTHIKNFDLSYERNGTLTVIGYTHENYKKNIEEKIQNQSGVWIVDIVVDRVRTEDLDRRAKEENLKLVGFYKIPKKIDNRFTYTSDFPLDIQTYSTLIIGVTDKGMLVNKDRLGHTGQVSVDDIIDIFK